jgi:uncharacterized protein (DUF983 family)
MTKEPGFSRSLFNFTCPRCRRGKLFTGPLRIKNALDMPDRCSHCGLKFEPEPGFYYGAMFISYIFIGFFSLGLLKMSVGESFTALIIVLLIGFLWNLRFARSLYIHLLTKYEPSRKDVVPQKQDK